MQSPTQLTDSQISADHKVPTTQSKENVDLVTSMVLSQEDTVQTHKTENLINHLSCYEITTMSSLAASLFYWNTVKYAKECIKF